MIFSPLRLRHQVLFQMLSSGAQYLIHGERNDLTLNRIHKKPFSQMAAWENGLHFCKNAYPHFRKHVVILSYWNLANCWSIDWVARWMRSVGNSRRAARGTGGAGIARLPGPLRPPCIVPALVLRRHFAPTLRLTSPLEVHELAIGT